MDFPLPSFSTHHVAAKQGEEKEANCVQLEVRTLDFFLMLFH
jgi:hypothetical protein